MMKCKKILCVCVTMLCLTTSSTLTFAASNSGYNRNTATTYANKWASKPNPSYNNYISEAAGGDCTNFVSQCLYAGGMSKSTTWKPYTSAWIMANPFRNYWMSKDYDYTVYTAGGAVGFWNDVYSDLWPGDVVQYGPSVSAGNAGHSQIVTGYNSSTKTTYVAQHSTSLSACKNNIDLEGYLMGKPTGSAFYTHVIKQGA